MKKCDKCNIVIETKQKYCPLCHQVLVGDTDKDFREVYPEYVSLRRMVLPTTKKVLMFVTLISIIILGTINWLETPPRQYWSLIPIGAIAYFWLLTRIGIFSKRNIAFRLGLMTVFLIVFIILIDYSNYSENNGWSVAYLMPLLLMSCNLAISMIMWIKRLDYRDYILYLLVIIIFSLVPLILVTVDVISKAEAWPSIASFGVAIFILFFIIFFFPKSIKEEIKKRFHA